jgi:SAM-dependent methyltransferase
MASFDDYARNYESLLDDPLRKRFADDAEFFIHQKCRVLLRHLRNAAPPHPRLVDVGCGQGTAMSFLRGEASVVGTDISIGMVRGAARGAVAVQEPFALPFADATFDAAYAFCVYHHIDDRDHVRHLSELFRVVTPGGRVFVFEHNPYNPVTRVVFNRAPIDRGCHMIEPRRLRSIFQQAGFDHLVQEYLLFFPEPLWKWIGGLEPALSWLPLGGQYFVSGRRPR